MKYSVLLFFFLLGMGSQNVNAFSDAEEKIIERIGAKISQDSCIVLGNLTLNPITKEISFPAETVVTDDILEVLITSPGGRLHETLLQSQIDPFQLQLLLYLAGGKNGTRKDGEGNQYCVEIEPEGGGRRPIEEWVAPYRENRHIPPRTWSFVGSSFSEGKECLAKREGNVLTLWDSGQTILTNPQDDGDLGNAFVPFKPNLPPASFNGPVKVKVYIFPSKV